MSVLDHVTSQRILDSVSDGVYVTDTNRRIIYWSASAERIVGWPASNVVGRQCHDDLLCHVDKDGHRLCGQEFCPLHRAMLIDQPSTVPFVVYAKQPSGTRVPLQVSVAPVHDDAGEVIGGVETFRDLSSDFRDIKRAQTIQSLSLQQELPADERIRFAVHYIPHDMIGGDFYAVSTIDDDHYGFLLADVSGHGVPAALYTMYLSSLWSSAYRRLVRPAEFAEWLNEHLHDLIKEVGPFAAGICGVVDATSGTLRLAGAGNPPPIMIRSTGEWRQLSGDGFPFGLLPDATYEETVMDLESGDCVLLFSDGAVEIRQPNEQLLGVDGLQQVLKDVGYPDGGADLATIERELLTRSDCIRFEDDLTLLEFRLS